MNTLMHRAALIAALATLALPSLTLAQAYYNPYNPYANTYPSSSYGMPDSESSEGMNCNDEMSESMPCTSQASYGSYGSPTSYSTQSYGTPYTSSAYQPSMQYQPQPSYSGSSYQPSMQYQAQPSYYPASGSSYNSYAPSQYSSGYGNYGSPSMYGPPSQSSYGYGMPQQNTSRPQTYSYPTGTYGTFGVQLCYWSDYPTYAPCGQDPQQWIQDPYTGQWY